MFKPPELFIRDWLGVRHVYNGRTYEGIDCYGLVLRYYEEVLGWPLPDWKCESTSSAWITRAMEEIAGDNFLSIDQPQDHCIVLIKRHRMAHHIGVFYGGHIIHCPEQEGVVYQPRLLIELAYRNVVYGVPCGSTAVSL